MSLPYPDMDFVPLDILTAAELNQLSANITSLADGSGLNDGSVLPSKLSDSFAVISSTSSSITLPIGKYLCICSVGLSCADITGSYATNVNFNGITRTFNGYRNSGQNRPSGEITFVSIVNSASQTTYSVTKTGSQVNLENYQIVAIPVI